ncbi:hypothetical protein [Solitalea koreensis]|uniref:Cytochrome c domain-containing protein n=1 Tax=Solitalea koreensis TaxID=543615 RepID=A0A521B9R6_9SPHI|nr:hypothetical protein [Solitalea koreensis]SMO43807.1 hypothetical protein SAMN06265350_10223 [Solitalea koreensis]
MKKNFLISLLLMVGLASCYYDKSGELHPEQSLGETTCDATGTMLYSKDVAPILSSYCGTGNSCHGGNNTSGVNLSTYSGVNAVATSGKLVSSITWDGKTSRMPQGSSSQLNDCSIAKIKKWVTDGHLNN